MKQLLALFALCAFIVPLSGTATAQDSAPVVVVYPLTVSGNADPQAGAKLSVLYAARLTALGGIQVKDPSPNTDRQHFLQAARAAGADYYLTGFLTPLGTSVTIINQLVSTHSGIQVWSDSVQVGSYNEGAGQADIIRAAIMRHAGHYVAALEATPPPPPPTAAPAKKTNDAALGALYPKATPAATPATGTSPAAAPPAAAPPAAAPPAAAPPLAAPPLAVPPFPAPPGAPPAAEPSGGPDASTAGPPSVEDLQIGVLLVAGKADAAGRYRATGDLTRQLNKRIKAPVALEATTNDFAFQGPDICRLNLFRSTARVFGGSLTLNRFDPGFSEFALATFDLIVYDCDGNVIAKEHSQRRTTGSQADDLAVDGAVADTLDALLSSKGKRR